MHALGELSKLLRDKKLPFVFEVTDEKFVYLNNYKVNYSAIDTDKDWKSEIGPQIEEYLRQHKPRERLQRIFDHASEIRTILLTNFSVDEILIQIDELNDYSEV